MKLTAFTEKDFTGLYEFMEPLWIETYGKILPREQIIFLLHKYFSSEGLAHYRAQGYRYYKIDEVGVLVFVERETETYMDKLYLLPKARGKGYAKFVFDELIKLGKDVVLNVNQANERAMRCYQKNGFAIESQTDILLENGMINRDFVMRKRK